MNLFDVQLPWFIPLYRRVLVVVTCAAMAAAEMLNNSPFWAILFGALAVYCAHQFFVAFDPKDPDAKAEKEK